MLIILNDRMHRNLKVARSVTLIKRAHERISSNIRRAKKEIESILFKIV